MPPFKPRDRARSTTRLPAALREELGLPSLPSTSQRRRQHDRPPTTNRPNLLVIGKPKGQQQAASATSSKPIQSKSNTHIDHQRSRKPTRPPSKPGQDSRNLESDRDEAAEELPPPAKRTRIDPFTGEEVIFEASKANQNKKAKTALEKLVDKAEAKASTNAGRSKLDHAKVKGKKRNKMTEAERNEEDEIAWLEHQLGKKGEGEIRDDLDDFLDDLDRFKTGMFDSDKGDSDDEDEDDEESEEDEGEDEMSGSGEESGEEIEDDDDDDDDEDEEEDPIDEEEIKRRKEMDELERMAKELEEKGFDDDDEDDFADWDAAMATTDEEQDSGSSEESSDGSVHESESELEKDDTMDVERAATKEETIKTSDTKASVPPAASSGKYIPPALRAAAAAAAESSGVVEVKGEQSVEQQKLRRQSQGLINRLGDSNIDAILTDFEGLYRTYRRADVTSTITRIILDTISSRSNLVDTFVVLYAAFVAAVHKAIGVEFGASFVQTLVEELVSHYEKLKKMDAEVEQMEEEDQPTKGKECLNLTVLVCHLYNLQVIACPLVYDLVKMFLGEGSGDNLSGNAGNGQSSKKSGVGMIETDVELLLKVVRCSGSQLRHDDPSSLKSIIQLTQDRVNSSSSPSNGKPTKLSSRSKFMLERLNDLKNNRSAKAIGNDSADPSSTVGQALTRMKKYLGGMGKKRTIRNHEPLRVTLKDLKDADKKGKWWLVGAAWTGHAEEDLEKAEGMTRFLPMSAATAKKGGALGGGASDEQAELFELAKKQGMNTEARRNVFVTLLSSEDYVDAAQKLLALRMNEVQRREIIRVLLHCLGSEKVYNPYYVLIGQQVCKDSHGMKVTLQYCLWDFLREIGEKEVGGRSMASRLDDGANEGEDSDEDDQDDEVKARKTNPRRIANLARAYGWWMAKGSITLNALKTINFTEVRSRGVTFLQLMIVNTILSTQTNSPVAQTLKPPKGSSGDEGSSSGQLKPLESVLLKGTSGNQELCKGLLLFCQRYLDRNHLKSLVGKERGVEFTLTRLEWGIQVMKDVLVIGSSSSFPSP